MSDLPETSTPNSSRQTSRRSFVKYAAAGVGLAAAGGAGLIAANRPPMSERQTDLPKLADWTADTMPSLQGRTALVTGGNGFPVGDISGLGYHAALQLARAGADVTIASRKADRGAKAIEQIKASVPDASIRFETLDLADLNSIAAFAERQRAAHSKLDILINNAGVMSRQTREVSVDGFERVFATNALGPFALTAQLLPLLRDAEASRVVWVSSMRAAAGTINFDDLQGEADFDYSAAYNHSKLACLLVAFQMRTRSAANAWGVSSIAAHPGVARTNIILDGPGTDSREGRNFKHLSAMFGPPQDRVLPILYAATSPDASAGAYYGPGGAGELGGLPNWAGIPLQAENEAIAVKLWSTLEQLGGVPFA